jgi:outer membrane protein W
MRAWELVAGGSGALAPALLPLPPKPVASAELGSVEEDMKLRRFVALLMVAAGVAVAATPASAQTSRPYNDFPNGLRLRIGLFEPNGDSQYWDQREVDFTGDEGDFQDTIFGLDYTHMLTERLGVLVSGSYYEGGNTAAFLDFEDDFGNDIVHDTTLEITSLDLGLVYHLLRRDATVSPYVGGGIGFYGYDLEESGDFIDFGTFDIFNGTFDASGNTVGGFFLAGLEIPITPQFGVFGEARWDWASDQLEDDFRDFGDIDLSGGQFAGGVSFRF